MTLYELIKNEKTTEIKSTGHISPCDFAKKIKSEFGIEVNIGDVKQTYERMTFKRNRDRSKPGQTFFKRCCADEFGANPITFVRLKNGNKKTD